MRNLHLKLTIAILVMFGLLLTGMYLYRPLRIKYYLWQYHSANGATRVAGVTGLINMGDEGREILARMLGSRSEVDWLAGVWDDVNKPDSEYKPVHIAADKGYSNVLRLLVDRGADVNDCLSPDGDSLVTPLHIASENGHFSTVKQLLNLGAKINARDDYSCTPLHLAVTYGYGDIAALLLAHGADVNTNDHWGQTPLHIAAEGNLVKMTEILLKHGANLNARIGNGIWSGINSENVKEVWTDKRNIAMKGWTPLHSAARCGQDDVASVLIDAGADIEAVDDLGLRPLHIAIMMDNNFLHVEFLLSKGAGINAEDIKGRTPLDWAVNYGRNRIAKLLKARGAKTGSFSKKTEKKQ